ncbi:SDR family NAD(P)-dependent oxidoreductase [Poseidonibacter ostreae]|jgi:short-subunit dehydrogenase|uniref:SDR family NAD(P)-dependent oxidoreductase n=1 Tax=Poseidonibacter ostreae TaxID=2654171 RepID=A0A6L4WQB4_9BACT|nr:SDR family NAD(P)-dependent oxidoreductase [Poseidonibacter ostreae]KAB7884956.1 SDR family NAD(P)-dependent oxidoreductase [Poseidonibacter ostreae]KAB7886747.1 SDR family NAD(P)-dependent oxidoreductase [Poseidonibacter ostreae]KAB7892961.1 SDR family NAD(P)-dependent oxidoreductase [Poseidonibacter ostreae]MAC83195.1 short-chain dehydrogenase [Arcobacter sp.]|tara:strand:- start:16477 stop:17253 length:777 start_codon:yes stop_codon:yes gene_type:complete
MEPKKRFWIVGGSSGIGLEVVKLCLLKNYLVIASSRTATTNEELKNLKKQFPKQLSLLDIDVSSKEDIKQKVKLAYLIYDGLDIWFYNAAAYDVMSIDSWDIEKFEQMNETNYLGVVRIMSNLLPYFKSKENLKKESIKWIWNCSLSSYFGLPQGGGYSAPKAALVNLAESIYPELELSNIKLQIINHGFVKTRLTLKNEFQMPQLMEAKDTAKKILESIENSSSFEIRFPFGLSSFLSLLKFLPYKVSLALTKKMLP